MRATSATKAVASNAVSVSIVNRRARQTKRGDTDEGGKIVQYEVEPVEYGLPLRH